MDLIIDKFGRVVLPKALRHEVGLKPGDSMTATTDGNQITLKPKTEPLGLVLDDGVWVWAGGGALADMTNIVQEFRQERLSTNMGSPSVARARRLGTSKRRNARGRK